MPQMGESIAEGTIVRWIKKVGDTVDRDEPLFEISTDKVDAEIPSPAAGVLTEIKVKEGETVPVNAVVGTIGEQGEAAARDRRPATKTARAAAAPADGSRRGRQPPRSPGRWLVGARLIARDRQRGLDVRRLHRSRTARAPRNRRQTTCDARNRLRWFAASRASTTSTSRSSRFRHRRPRHQARHPRFIDREPRTAVARQA